MKVQKIVTVDGVEWKVVGANERGTTRGDRHFYASRHRSSGCWNLREHDQQIDVTGQAKVLRYFLEEYDPEVISAAVLEICGEAQPVRTCRNCYMLSQVDGDVCPNCGAHEMHEAHPFTTSREEYLQRR